uniref:Uncharacterized protein n=1 Tax=Anguilla anguilla TaxID=7936 RepID=A0A0E9TPP2_ANGAN
MFVQDRDVYFLLLFFSVILSFLQISLFITVLSCSLCGLRVSHVF